MITQVVNIKMITSDGCKQCKAVERRIFNVVAQFPVTIHITKIDSRSPQAIELGIEYGLDDVPSFVVGGVPFSGERFTDKELSIAIKNCISKTTGTKTRGARIR